MYFQMLFSLDYIVHAFPRQNYPRFFATQSTVSAGMWRVLSTQTSIYCIVVY